MNTNGLLERPGHETGSRSNRHSLVSLVVGWVVGFCIAELFILSTTNRPDNVLYADHQYGDANDIIEENGLETDMGIHPHEHKNENSSIATKLYNEVRVLCWVMTNPKNHKRKALHVKRTWGQRCNKLLFMSSTADSELGTVALPVEEGRNNLWAKTKEAHKYIYEHHKDDAEWFFKADDDTYAIAENLRYMLYPYSPDTPIYFGCKLKSQVKQGYMSGGAGYVLTKEAIRRFVQEAIPNSMLCKEGNSGAEDVEIGYCLANVRVIAGDSRDVLARGRFFPFLPKHHLIPPNTYKKFWYWQLIYYKTEEGLDCCSDNAISYVHYVSPIQMYVLDYLIYHLRPYGIINTPQYLPEKLRLGEVLPPPLEPTTEPSDNPTKPA